ncbi:cytochrome P450 [Atractiella rhizophila]|nr:cytochrome P450 [Atractiella rhizophila]
MAHSLSNLSNTEFVLLSTVVFFLFLLVKYRNRAIFTKDRPDLVHQPGLPILGNFLTIMKYRKRNHEYSLANFRERGYGTATTMPFTRMIDISKPEWIEYVQKTNFDNYPKGWLFMSVTSDFWGIGIFNADGSPWYYQRKIISHIFSVSRFKSVISSSINQSAKDFVAFLDDLASNKAEYLLSDGFYRFTMESFNRMAFGEDLGLLERGNIHKVVPFAKAFDDAHIQLNKRFMDPTFWKLTEMLTSSGRKMKENIRLVDEYAYSIIRSRKAARKESEGKESAQKDLLDLFLEMTHEDGSRLSEKEVRDMVLNLIIAGRDTTAAALSYSFFRLIMHPKYINWLREEIEERKATDGTTDDDFIAYDNYKTFVRAVAFFHETLRLHPSVPGNVKVVLKDDQLPNGPRLEAGDLVRWDDWQMGRDENIWPNACEFTPERWIDEKGHFKQVSPYKFHAFNAGPRLCVGQNLATFEAVYVIVTLINRYDFSFADGWWENCRKTNGVEGIQDNCPLYLDTLVPGPKDGLKVKIRRRITQSA